MEPRNAIPHYPSREGCIYLRNGVFMISKSHVRTLGMLLLVLGCVALGTSRAEVILQYFNTSYRELADKMPELAEVGYGSLWLPPPTKGSGGLSVGYDCWDPFDLGGKDQRGTVRTRYGTEDDLLYLIEVAHRHGLRVYFDNIMNHRAFDVPGFNEYTPIDTYPGMVPEDFHLRVRRKASIASGTTSPTGATPGRSSTATSPT